MRHRLATLALIATLAAAPAYPQKRSQAAQASADSPRHDTDVLTEVYHALGSDHALQGKGNNIQAEVHKGAVKLTGTVPSEAAKELADNDLLDIEGVRTVLNNLTIADSAATPTPTSAAPTTPAATFSVPAPAASSMTARVPGDRVQQRQLTSPAMMTVRVDEEITTKTAKVGDTFRGEVLSTVYQNGVALIPAHTPVTGRVVTAKPAGRLTGYAELTLELVAMRLAVPNAGDQTVSISTAPLSSRANGRGANTAGKTVGGAGPGAVIGALAGGGTGAAVGAASGGALGAGANALIPASRSSSSRKRCSSSQPPSLSRSGFYPATARSCLLKLRRGWIRWIGAARGQPTRNQRSEAGTGGRCHVRR